MGGGFLGLTVVFKRTKWNHYRQQSTRFFLSSERIGEPDNKINLNTNFVKLYFTTKVSFTQYSDRYQMTVYMTTENGSQISQTLPKT